STSAAAGWFSGEATPLSQAWVILGLAAAGQPVPISATNWLIEAQEEDGSWAAGDPDTTALAVVALIGSGNVQPTDAPIQRALAWFKANQLPGGGWRPTWDTDPANANSTGMALQALMAAGYVPPTASWSTAQGDPIQALLGLQKGDGRIGGTYANAYSTVDAIAGLSERPLFMLGRAARVRRGLAWISKQQNADGSWSGFSGPDAGATSDAVLAYVAAGYDPDTVMIPGGLSATEYLSANVASYAAQSADRAGKLALTVVA
ncbi:MAG: terpene cyclase/mutase family protein, partial [Clostridia bacterium]|nr:terpene cyclase/mutase family protein [Clostridia bacterium]